MESVPHLAKERHGGCQVLWQDGEETAGRADTQPSEHSSLHTATPNWFLKYPPFPRQSFYPSQAHSPLPPPSLASCPPRGLIRVKAGGLSLALAFGTGVSLWGMEGRGRQLAMRCGLFHLYLPATPKLFRFLVTIPAGCRPVRWGQGRRMLR